MSDVRRERERRGRAAEEFAKWALRLKGYRILAHRVRLKTGEIDLVASRGHVLAFVEVKARRTLEQGLEAMPDGAWRRVARTAENWSARRSRYDQYDWRYDLVVVAARAWPRHYPDYWRPDS